MLFKDFLDKQDYYDAMNIEYDSDCKMFCKDTNDWFDAYDLLGNKSLKSFDYIWQNKQTVIDIVLGN